jgi:Ser/Thr protein kinase RdoA (MazF antagonist)
LFDFLEGYYQYHHYFLLPGQAQRFIAVSGKALGALHMALRDFTPAGYHPNGLKSKQGERWRELNWITDKLDWCRPRVADLQADGADLLRASFFTHANRIEETLHILDDRIKAASLPSLIIHGDYGPYNLFFKHGAPPIILDFELARLDWRLADLAMALPFFANDLLGFSYPKLRVFLEGYQTCCPIDSAELSLLPTVWQFLMLRQVLFFWYRFCDTPSKHWITEAQRKLTIGLWLKDNETTLSGWLMRF